MNVHGIIENLQAAFGRLGQNLVIQADGRFSDSLTLGQVLKGKVLLHYEGTRYGVSFGGEQRIVDSAVPLRTGDIIYGRVVGLGDKVHLKLQAAPDAAQQQFTAPAPRGLAEMSSREGLLVQLFDRHQETLAPKELERIVRLMGRAAKPELMALSALVVSKSGLRLSSEVMQSVYRVLERKKPAPLWQEAANVPQLSLSDGLLGNCIEEITVLARTLENMLELRDAVREQGEPEADSSHEHHMSGDSPAETGADFAGGRNSDAQGDLGTWLLNGQTDGSVAHRMSSFPVWFGERLIEVSAAFFNQRERAAGDNELRYRRIVLALDTELLGHVELVVSMARQNCRVEIRTEDDEVTEAMADHLLELREQLVELGWNVDGISYATASPEQRGEVVRSVVEHFITQDSVNQLV